MNNWILFDEFVDRVRDFHRSGFSGLITGISEQKHSFQIGFDNGRIVLLTYRIKKGPEALELISNIERVKITVHVNSDIADADDTVPDTKAVLSQLTSNAHDDTTAKTDPTNFDDIQSMQPTAKSSAGLQMDATLKQAIKIAAVHHFGPIGAMVCEEYLAQGETDMKTILVQIAEDVGANKSDTRAFFESVSKRNR